MLSECLLVMSMDFNFRGLLILGGGFKFVFHLFEKVMFLSMISSRVHLPCLLITGSVLERNSSHRGNVYGASLMIYVSFGSVIVVCLVRNVRQIMRYLV